MKIKPTDVSILNKTFTRNGYSICGTHADLDIILLAANIDVNANELFNDLSQGKKLGVIWGNFNAPTVVKVIKGLLDYNEQTSKSLTDEEIDKATEIMHRYLGIDTFIFTGNLPEDYKNVANYIQDNLATNPKLCIDRVHTLAHYVLCQLCQKYEVPYYKNEANDDKKPIGILYQNLMPKVMIHHCKENEEQFIIKSLEGLFNQEFNNIRNKQSLAHANDKLINTKEAKYITTAVMNALQYLMDKLSV